MNKSFATAVILLFCVLNAGASERARPGGFFGGGGGRPSQYPAGQTDRPPSSYLEVEPYSKRWAQRSAQEKVRGNCSLDFPKNGTLKLLTSAEKYPDTTEWTINNTSDTKVAILAHVGAEEVAELYVGPKSEARFVVPALPMNLTVQAGTSWCGLRQGFEDGVPPLRQLLPNLFGKSSDGETTKIVLQGSVIFAYTKERYLVIKE